MKRSVLKLSVPLFTLLILVLASNVVARDLGPLGGDGITSVPKLKVPDAKLIFCEKIPAPTTNRVCEVTTGNRALLIKGNVLGLDAVYQGGEVLVDETGLIRHAGCSADRSQDLDAIAVGATLVECADGVVSPGLINPHDHLGYDQNAPSPATTVRYDHRNDWRSSSTAVVAPSDYDQAKVTWTELRQVMSGTTSIAGAGSEVGFLRNLDPPWWSYPVFDDLLWDVFSVNPTEIVTDTFPLEDPWEYQQYEECSYTYYGRSKNFYTNVYVPHVAEGVNAAAHNEFICLSSAASGGVDVLDSDSVIVHGIALNATDGNSLAEDGTSLIWSPRSNMSLYGNTAPVSMLKNQGVLIALGADWTPSGSMNIGRELVCADELNTRYLDHVFSDRELWSMVTYNPAVALQVDDKVGSLRAGQFADIAIYDGRENENPYRAVIGANAKSTVVVFRRSSMPFPYLGGPDYVGSIALYGDAEVLESLPSSMHELYAPGFGITEPLCEPLQVCGEAKWVCPLRETWPTFLDSSFGNPFSLGALEAANTDSYPLFFCDEPPDEPTCVPQRPGEYDGAIVLKNPGKDSDGDGVSDGDDNCKKVFNPVRPMDAGTQADVDGDGRGDACDKCPLDVGAECTAVDPYTGEEIHIIDGD